VNVQAVGTSAQQASQLTAPTPTPAASPKPTGTITQIQIGCLSQCFGSTTTSTIPEPVAQQILDELSSLVPPTGATSTQPSPGIDQTVIDQISCQVQTGGPGPGTQVQIATQTSATVQPTVPSSGSQPTAIDQTGQRTWQLQIGCLFYCTDTQQVQQAQQTIATIQVLVGPPGSSTPSTTDAVGGVSQVIWQLQIGCIEWCYDATQVQDGTSQTTVIVIVPVPPASPAPPTPPPADTTDDPQPADTTDDPQPGPADGAAAAASPPTTAVHAAATTVLLRSTTRTGIAILVRRPTAAPAAILPGVSVASRVSLGRSMTTASSAPRAFVALATRRSSAHARQQPLAPASTAAVRSAPVEAVAARPGSTPTLLFVALGLAAAIGLWAFRRRRPTRPGR